MPNVDTRRSRAEKEPAAAPDPEEVARELEALARRLGYRYVDDLVERPIDPEAWELVPGSMMHRHRLVPMGFEGKNLVVAMANPADVIALDDVRTTSGKDLDVIVARPEEIDELLSRLDKLDRTAETLLEEAAQKEQDEQEEELSPDEAPIVKAINRIITRAVQQRASDIHIEPGAKDVRIRFRIDGVLTDAMHTRRSLHAGMTSRLKVMADLDISERRVPQDGRVTVKVEGRHVDLRVATLPTSWGEKIVLRILDHGQGGVRQLSELGFGPESLDQYRGAVARPHGAILVTGPTGSGKSTTLYATLETINTPGLNIITVEDPVEARIAGLNQVQINPKTGLTFATALRSILRTDPDVVMVGEMRDQETAAIGIQAALTGHLVFSTLHTNDAVSAIIRLTDMGVEPFLVASALECVVAQRLARKLCTKCAEAYTPDQEMVVSTGIPWEPGTELPTLRRPVGCGACAGTGYRGRVAIVEVLRMSDELRALTVGRYPAEDIKKQAAYEGLVTLREDGLSKALAGVTSVEEVLRVVV